MKNKITINAQLGKTLRVKKSNKFFLNSNEIRGKLITFLCTADILFVKNLPWNFWSIYQKHIEETTKLKDI